MLVVRYMTVPANGRGFGFFGSSAAACCAVSAAGAGAVEGAATDGVSVPAWSGLGAVEGRALLSEAGGASCAWSPGAAANA